MEILRFLMLLVLLPCLLFRLPKAQIINEEMLIKTSVDGEGAAAPAPKPTECDGACKSRCEESSRPKLCHRACGTCCSRCGCVPSGTAGNYDECPCYRDMTTHGGKHKCP